MGNATSMPESEIGKVLGKNLELVGPVRGGVNRLLSTLQHALREERHFALVEKSAVPTKGSHRNRFRSGTRSDPFVSSVATPIMITNSDSP